MNKKNTNKNTNNKNKVSAVIETRVYRKLKRNLNLPDAVAIGLGAVIGAGIFVVSGQAAGVAGPAMLVSLIVAGIAASANGLSSAQLASIYPQSGGTYEYGYELVSPWAGFSAGWMFLTSKLAAGGVVALGFGSYLNNLFPAIHPQVAAVLAVVLLTLANLFGIKKAGLLNRVIVSITLLVLLTFIAAGLTRADVSNFQPFWTGGFRGTAEAAALMFFAFTGYARVATLGEEIQNPRRNIPRAVVLTLAISLVLYLLVAGTALGGVGAEAMAASGSPLVTASEQMGFGWLGNLVSIAAATAMLGVLLSQILGISRMFFAMAKREDLPHFFSKVSPRSAVPTAGILVSGLIILTLVLVGNISFILSAASFTILLYYSIANLSALRVPREQRFLPKWVSVMGLIFCLAMAVSLKPVTILAGLAVLAIGLVYRAIYRRI